MAVPQLVLDAIRFLLALAAPASLVALVLAGIALRREGTTSFSVGGGGASKWMFWTIVMITLPQVFGWFAFWGVGAPLPGGGIGNGWMSGFAMTPGWLYLPMARATGELAEYMAKSRDRQAGCAVFTETERVQLESADPTLWLEGLQSYTKRWVQEHQAGGADTWTVVANNAA